MRIQRAQADQQGMKGKLWPMPGADAHDGYG